MSSVQSSLRGDSKSLHVGGQKQLMGTTCIVSLLFYRTTKSRNATKLLSCFVAAPLEIAGSKVVLWRQCSEPHTSVLSGAYFQLPAAGIKSDLEILFPHKSNFDCLIFKSPVFLVEKNS